MKDKISISPFLQQQVKFFVAKDGKWSYGRQQFYADTVTLSFLKLPGSELPENTEGKKSFLQGVAQGVQFAFLDKKPSFTAEKFRASMQSDEDK